MNLQLHSTDRTDRQASRPRGTHAARALFGVVGLAVACTLGCAADASRDEAPSWASELSHLDAGAADGSALRADALDDRLAVRSADRLALPESGQRAQQQRVGDTTLWFAQYDNQVWEQRADGTLRRSFDDGVRFERLPNNGADGAPTMLLHGGFASDGSFWGVEADTVWHYDRDAWQRHDRSAGFSPDAGAFAVIAPDPASNAVIVATADGQLWQTASSRRAWQRLKDDSATDLSAPHFAAEADARFEFDATIAGRVWHTTRSAAWYADLTEDGYARWAQDDRPAREREASPMRAPVDNTWL